MIGWKAVSTDRNVASVRYRCLNPLEKLRQRDFPVALFNLRDLPSYRTVIFSKVYDAAAQKLAQDLRRKGQKVILDLCDNHFYNPNQLPKYAQARHNLAAMIGLSDLVICSTETLAGTVQREADLAYTPPIVADAVEPLPIDRPATHNDPDQLVQLLWFGAHGSPNAPSGMEALRQIFPILNQKSRKYAFELVVTSNHKQKFQSLIRDVDFAARYVDWTHDQFSALLSRTAAVVIPIIRNPFNDCKSNNRLATSLFHGVPVIADSIPGYREFDRYCYLDDWDRGLDAALSGSADLQDRTARGSDYVQNNYSIDAIAQQWQSVLEPFVN